MSDETGTIVDPVFYEGSYTTDAGYADRFVRASFRYRMNATRIVQRLALIAVAATLVAVLSPAAALTFRILLGVAFFIGLALAAAVSIAISFAWNRQRMRSLAPANRTYSVSLRNESLGLRDWMISSENSYAIWRSATIVGDYIVLQRAQSTIYTPLPRQLFTPQAEAWLIQRINGQPAAAN